MDIVLYAVGLLIGVSLGLIGAGGAMEFTPASVNSSDKSWASGPCEFERRRVVERRRALSAEGVVLDGLRSYDIGDDLGGVLTLLFLTMVTDDKCWQLIKTCNEKKEVELELGQRCSENSTATALTMSVAATLNTKHAC